MLLKKREIFLLLCIGILHKHEADLFSLLEQVLINDSVGEEILMVSAFAGMLRHSKQKKE